MSIDVRIDHGRLKELHGTLLQRARERRAEQELREMWAESERRDEERRRKDNLKLWYEFHARLSESHARLSEEHRQKAEALAKQSRV